MHNCHRYLQRNLAIAYKVLIYLILIQIISCQISTPNNENVNKLENDFPTESPIKTTNSTESIEEKHLSVDKSIDLKHESGYFWKKAKTKAKGVILFNVPTKSKKDEINKNIISSNQQEPQLLSVQKNLWKKATKKVQTFNMLTRNHSEGVQDVDSQYLKPKILWKKAIKKVQTLNTMTTQYNEDHIRLDIGDAVVLTDDQAKQIQWSIEKSFKRKLSFDIHAGDIVLGDFTNMPKTGKAKMVSKNPRTKKIISDRHKSIQKRRQSEIDEKKYQRTQRRKGNNKIGPDSNLRPLSAQTCYSVRSFESEANENVNEDAVVEEIEDKRFIPIIVISNC